MKPILKIGEHDYTAFVAEDGISFSRNDLDADGAGRNILDGTMYRSRICAKAKLEVSFNRLPDTIARSIAADLNADFVAVTVLDPENGEYSTRTYYTATLEYGTQQYDPGSGMVWYTGTKFDLTEK